MGIQIIPEPDIRLTQAEYERLKLEWARGQMYTSAPVSFETWLRQRKQACDKKTRRQS